MTGAAPAPGGEGDLRAAALEHLHAVAVDKRAGDLLRAPDHHPVGAVHPPAAKVERHEQVVVVALADHERRFNRAGIDVARGQAVERLIFGGEQTGLVVQAAHLDPRPEAAEDQPGHAVFIDDQVGVDTVIVVRGERLDHRAMIHPAPALFLAVERGVRRQADGGAVGAEGGDGVVQVIGVVVEGDIRRPEVGGADPHLARPPGHAAKDDRRPGHLPLEQIGGFAHLEAGGRAEQVIRGAGLDDRRVVHRRDPTG